MEKKKKKEKKEEKKKKKKEMHIKNETKKTGHHWKGKISSAKTTMLWSILFTTRGFQVDKKKRRQLNIKEATQKWRYRFPLDCDDAPREAGLVSRPSLGPISE